LIHAGNLAVQKDITLTMSTVQMDLWMFCRSICFLYYR